MDSGYLDAGYTEQNEGGGESTKGSVHNCARHEIAASCRRRAAELTEKSGRRVQKSSEGNFNAKKSEKWRECLDNLNLKLKLRTPGKHLK